METPINTNQNTPTENTEFAKKEPILYKKTIIKIVFLSLTFFLFIGIAIVGFQIYKSIKEIKPPEIIEEEPIITDEPLKVDVPIFAYIKDEKSIWQSDINGENKSRILEIPGSSTEKYTSVAWKSAESISYSKYNNENSVIETINTRDKGILTELSDQKGIIDNLVWGGNNYLAYTIIQQATGQGQYQIFMFKAGTILSELFKFQTTPEESVLHTRVVFSEEGGFVIFAGQRNEINEESDTGREIRKIPFIQVYQFNGTLVDQIDNASDPMVIEKDKIAFKYDGYLSAKYIGQPDITKITPISGSNPTVSFNKDKYAYWNSTGGFANALLIVYDTNLNYQRNILRGVLLPEWISPNKVVGIRADNCLGSNCELYQFQTNSLAIVETDLGKVIEVDQGRSINSISYNRWYAN